MEYNGREISQELLRKAQQCKTAQELIELAKEHKIELSMDDAEAFLDETACIELDEEMLKLVAGGAGLIIDNCFIYACPDDLYVSAVRDRNRIDE